MRSMVKNRDTEMKLNSLMRQCSVKHAANHVLLYGTALNYAGCKTLSTEAPRAICCWGYPFRRSISMFPDRSSVH